MRGAPLSPQQQREFHGDAGWCCCAERMQDLSAPHMSKLLSTLDSRWLP
jgi:hypothetical protein